MAAFVSPARCSPDYWILRITSLLSRDSRRNMLDITPSISLKCLVLH